MGSMLFDAGLLFGIVWDGWGRLEGLDGPALGKVAQVAVLVVYFQWMASLTLAWCLLVLAFGWPAWWWIASVWLLFIGEGYLVVDWQRVRRGQVILRRRNLLRPATRRTWGQALGAALPALVALALYVAGHAWYPACVVVLVVLWCCQSLLIETILG
jgi:hypothetical protein